MAVLLLTCPQSMHKESMVTMPLSSRMYGKSGARFVDRLARYLFPGCFLVFNLGYWLIYTFVEF